MTSVNGYRSTVHILLEYVCVELDTEKTAENK